MNTKTQEVKVEVKVKYTIGIDPGLTGGVAFKNNIFTGLYTMPVLKKRSIVDVQALYQMLKQRPYERIDHVYIERVQVRSHFAGTATAGINYGRILGVLELLELPYTEVPGNVWQKKVFGKIKGRDNLKAESIRKALELGLIVPTINAKGKVLSDGATDAYWVMVSQL